MSKLRIIMIITRWLYAIIGMEKRVRALARVAIFISIIVDIFQKHVIFQLPTNNQAKIENNRRK